MSERKLRLFACACCRRIWSDLSPACQRAVEVAERFADGQASPRELAAIQGECMRFERVNRRQYRLTEQVHRVAAQTFTRSDAAAVAADLRPWQGESLENHQTDAAQALIERDVLGGPEMSAVSGAFGVTAPVLALARAIYAGSDFERLSALADALEAAGCRDGDVLAHCRSGGEHYHGCWALDAILGYPQ